MLCKLLTNNLAQSISPPVTRQKQVYGFQSYATTDSMLIENSNTSVWGVKRYLRDSNWRIVTDQVLGMWLEIKVIRW